MSLTHKRDLRDGNPVWAAYRHRRIHESRLSRSTRAEVVIVGAGITGALVADALTQCGLRPLILERRREALLGSTAASTALLQFELDTPLIHLNRRIGVRNATRVWRCSKAAVDELRTRVLELGLSVNLHTRPSLYLAGDLLDAKGLQREMRARHRAGLPSEYLDTRELRRHFDIKAGGAILSYGNAEADPVALAGEFLAHAMKRGARFHAPHEVTDVRATARGITVLTKDGVEVLTRRLILCTGYELPKIVPTAGHQIASTWAMATAPQPNEIWRQRALIWEASDPYHYFRSTPDGRVICGGEDEEFADEPRRNAKAPAKRARLEKTLARLFPNLDPRAAFSWCGSFGSSETGMPSIGEIPGHPRCFSVLGYGGNGITFSMLAARFLSAAVRGRPDPDARLFRFK